MDILSSFDQEDEQRRKQLVKRKRKQLEKQQKEKEMLDQQARKVLQQQKEQVLNRVNYGGGVASSSRPQMHVSSPRKPPSTASTKKPAIARQPARLSQKKLSGSAAAQGVAKSSSRGAPDFLQKAKEVQTVRETRRLSLERQGSGLVNVGKPIKKLKMSYNQQELQDNLDHTDKLADFFANKEDNICNLFLDRLDKIQPTVNKQKLSPSSIVPKNSTNRQEDDKRARVLGEPDKSSIIAAAPPQRHEPKPHQRQDVVAPRKQQSRAVVASNPREKRREPKPLNTTNESKLAELKRLREQLKRKLEREGRRERQDDKHSKSERHKQSTSAAASRHDHHPTERRERLPIKTSSIAAQSKSHCDERSQKLQVLKELQAKLEAKVSSSKQSSWPSKVANVPSKAAILKERVLAAYGRSMERQQPAKKRPYDPLQSLGGGSGILRKKPYSSESSSEEAESRSEIKQRRNDGNFEKGMGGKQYVYRGSSYDEEESSMSEASFGEIEEEELETLRQGELEDEQERLERRNRRKEKKWKRRKQLGEQISLSDVSSEDSSEDDF